jgi:hypothetical protein
MLLVSASVAMTPLAFFQHVDDQGGPAAADRSTSAIGALLPIAL